MLVHQIQLLHPNCNSFWVDTVGAVHEIESLLLPSDLHIVSISPNPCNSVIFVSIFSEQTQNANIEIIDIHGKLIANQGLVVLKQGENILNRNLSGLSSGIYIFSIDTGKQKLSKPFYFIK